MLKTKVLKPSHHSIIISLCPYFHRNFSFPEYYLDVMDANDNLGVSNRMAARGRNLQFDLGMDLNSSAEQIISFMEAHFDSVLIAEVLDSSLAQLASQLCWPLSSVTYFPQNQRSQRKVSIVFRPIRKKIVTNALMDGHVAGFPKIKGSMDGLAMVHTS